MQRLFRPWLFFLFFFYIIVIIINSVDPAAPDLDADSGAIICSLMKTATMRV